MQAVCSNIALVKNIYNCLRLIIFLGFFSLFIFGCGEQILEDSDLNRMLGTEIYPEKQTNPKEINLYVDLSFSMQNYLSRFLRSSSDYFLYEEYIRGLFSNRQDAKINIYGFGDEIYPLGSNDEAVQSLINQNTYDKKVTRINKVFDKIQNDTSLSLNIVLTDALHEESGESQNSLSFLMSPYIKSQVAKRKLFSLFAKKLGYYGDITRKVYNSPLYLFVFGEYSYNHYLTSNLAVINDDYFIIAPEYKYTSKISLSSNTSLLMQKSNYITIETEDYSIPVNLKIYFERDISNNIIRNKILEDKYDIMIFEKLIRFDEQREMYVCDTLWTKSSINDPQCILVNKFNNDTTKQTFTVEFNKSLKEQNNYKIYKIAVISHGYKSIIAKYNTDSQENIEKTYRFNDFFNNLQNHLNENPVPLFTYFLVIK